jgi:ABC-2 type transport system permease protein
MNTVFAKSILTVAGREYRSAFASPIAYVFLAAFLAAVSWFFFRGFFLIGQADLRLLFELIPWLYLFFIPAVTMGKWAEEQKQGTIETLFTLPVRDVDLVVGKFISGFLLLATALLLTLPIPLTVAIVGPLDLGPAIGGYLGLLLLGAAYLSIGLTISALTESQIIAFIGGTACCFLMFVIGTPFITGSAQSLPLRVIQYLGLSQHFASIARGVIDSRDIVYAFSFVAFFLYLNVKALERRRRQ